MEKESKGNSFLWIGIISAAMLVLGYAAGQRNIIDIKGASTLDYALTGDLNPGGRTSELDFNQFWTIWDTLESRYVNKNLDEKKMLEGAIKGLVNSLDDYATVYYTSEETAEYDEVSGGNFDGIGAELGYDAGQIIITSPIKGFPAQQAGLRANDRILKIDDVSTEGMDIVDAVVRIRGERSTTVKLNIYTPGEDKARDVEITRETIHVESVEWEEMSDGVIRVEIRRFSDDSFTTWMASWDKVMDEVAAKNPKGIILDLRGNPGGFFDAAVWAASDFLEEGKVVSMQEDRDGVRKEFKVSREGKFLSTPLVVLIDEGSASASEILAGALEQYDRATLIGKETFGKGTAQNVLDITGGATLHITTQKWLLPDGGWINQENKIKPDVEVEFTKEEFQQGNDPQLDRALEEILK